MQKPDSLFSLIRSLSAAEKRYFRLFAGQHLGGKEGRAIQLFDTLEVLPEYHESRVKRSLSDETLRRQYAVYKNLLFNLILRALQNYQYERSPAMKVRSGIDKASILAGKNLFGPALKLLLKTKALALREDQFASLPEILLWERRLSRRVYAGAYQEVLPAIHQSQTAIRSQLDQEMEAIALYDDLFAIAQVERRSEKKELKTVLDACEKRALKLKRNRKLSFGALSALHSALGLLFQLKAQHEKMYEAYSALIHLWESHPQHIASEPGRFARLQATWLNSVFAAGKLKFHLPKIKELQNSRGLSAPEQAVMVFQSFHLELLWALEQKNLSRAAELLPPFEKRIAELSPFIDRSRLEIFFYNAFQIFFRAGKYNNANAWLQKIIIMEPAGKDTGLFRTAFLLSLIVHSELGNHSVVESHLKSLARRLSKQDKDWAFGAFALPWIKKIALNWDTKSQAPLRKEFAKALAAFQKTQSPVPHGLNMLRFWAQR